MVVIVFSDLVSKKGVPFSSSLKVAVIYLVTYAEYDDRRMVSVLHYPGTNVLLIPYGEKSCIVELGLFVFPHIKSFGVDENSHLVGQIQ